MDVEISLPNNLKDANVFQFVVRHDDADDLILGPITHWGTIVVHRVNENNLGAGQ